MDTQHNSPSCCALFAGAVREVESPLVIIARTAQHRILNFATVMCIVNLLLPIGILVYAKLAGEDQLKIFEGERNLMTWFSTLQLLIVGLVAYVNHQAAVLLNHISGTNVKGTWIWVIFAAGFMFLAIDERFTVHEIIRNDLLKPANLFVGLSYLRAGDIGLYVYFIIGLIFSWFLLGELRKVPISLGFFGMALVLSFVVVVVDSLPLSITRSWPGGNFWDSAFEEISEIWAQLLFLFSFLAVLYRRLSDLVAVVSSEPLDKQPSNA